MEDEGETNRKHVNKLKATKFILNSVLTIGSLSGICPIRWNAVAKRLTVFNITNSLKSSKMNTYNIWRVYFTGFIATRLGYVAYMLFCLITLDTTTMELVLSCLYIPLIAIGISDHIFNLCHSQNIVRHVTQLATFNDRANSLIGGNELLDHVTTLCLAYGGEVILYVLAIPVTIVGANLNYPFLRFFNVNGNVLLSVGFGVGLLLDMVGSFGPSSFVFLHISLTLHWLQKFQTTWQGKTAIPQTAQEMRNIYRQMQLLHISKLDITSKYVMAIFPVGAVGATFIIYAAIKHFEQTSIFVTMGEFALAAMLVGMYRHTQRLSVGITSLSAEYGEMKFVNDANPEDARFFKSCRPFYWKVGPYTYTRLTFPNLVDNIVGNVINLLMLSA